MISDKLIPKFHCDKIFDLVALIVAINCEGGSRFVCFSLQSGFSMNTVRKGSLTWVSSNRQARSRLMMAHS